MSSFNVALVLLLLYLFFSVCIGVLSGFHYRIISLMSDNVDSIKNKDVIEFLLLLPFSVCIYICESVFKFFFTLREKNKSKYFISILTWLDKDIRKK